MSSGRATAGMSQSPASLSRGAKVAQAGETRRPGDRSELEAARQPVSPRRRRRCQRQRRRRTRASLGWRVEGRERHGYPACLEHAHECLDPGGSRRDQDRHAPAAERGRARTESRAGAQGTLVHLGDRSASPCRPRRRGGARPRPRGDVTETSQERGGRRCHGGFVHLRAPAREGIGPVFRRMGGRAKTMRGSLVDDVWAPSPMRGEKGMSLFNFDYRQQAMARGRRGSAHPGAGARGRCSGARRVRRQQHQREHRGQAFCYNEAAQADCSGPTVQACYGASDAQTLARPTRRPASTCGSRRRHCNPEQPELPP